MTERLVNGRGISRWRNRRQRLLLGAGGGGGAGVPAANTFTYSTSLDTSRSDWWGAQFNDDGTVLYFANAANGSLQHSATDFTTPYVVEEAVINTTLTSVTGSMGGSADRCFAWHSDGRGIFVGDIVNGDITSYPIGASASAYNPTVGVGWGLEALEATYNVAAGFDIRQMWARPDGKMIVVTSNDSVTYGSQARSIWLSTADDLTTASQGDTYNPTEPIRDLQFDTTGNSGYIMYEDGSANQMVAKFTCSVQWDISTITIDTANAINTTAVATDEFPLQIITVPDNSRLYIVGWDNLGLDKLQVWT